MGILPPLDDPDLRDKAEFLIAIETPSPPRAQTSALVR
jgi:hypothetical protein